MNDQLLTFYGDWYGCDPTQLSADQMLPAQPTETTSRQAHAPATTGTPATTRERPSQGPA